MSDLAGLIATPEGPRPPVQGLIHRAPASVGDTVRVLVPGFSGDHFYEVDHWDPRGVALPQVGDKALLIFDEDGEPWLLWDGDVAAAGALPAGTTLPTSGLVDGQIYTYDADPTNGVKWMLQYRAAATTYKWEFVGGSWKEYNVATAYNQTTANTWQQLNSSLQVTLPLSGYYDFELVCYAYDNAGTNNGKVIVAPYGNSPSAAVGPPSYTFHGPGGGYGVSPRATGRTSALDKTYPFKFYVASNPGAFTMQDWWIRIKPVRVI